MHYQNNFDVILLTIHKYFDDTFNAEAEQLIAWLEIANSFPARN